MKHAVGIGQYIISNNKEDVISTYALGSCVAVTIYCPLKLVAGMIHIALPSKLISDNISKHPGYYADVGLPIFIKKILYTYGCEKESLIVGLYGGAIAKRPDIFDIGPRNKNKIKEILRDFQMFPSINDTGGNISRTIHMDVSTGNINTVVQPMII